MDMQKDDYKSHAVAEEAGVVVGDSIPIDAAAERSVVRKLDFRYFLHPLACWRDAHL